VEHFKAELEEYIRYYNNDRIKMSLDAMSPVKYRSHQKYIYLLIRPSFGGKFKFGAFIFCLYCGLRFCDVKGLTFRNVDYSNRLLKFEQNKTKGHSASSGVIIPLNDGLLSLIGNPPESGNLDGFVFTLPSYESCW
jgi:integrase